jgi:hypothetical protein
VLGGIGTSANGIGQCLPSIVVPVPVVPALPRTCG